jgi:hypothetical protein
VGVHLQLFPPTLSGWTGCAYILLVLFAPGVIIAYIFQSPVWLIVVPVSIVASLLLLAVMLPLFKPDFGKRKVSTEKFADELERHLLGTEGKWDWDDVTSVRIADKRLEQIRQELSRFDSLSHEKDKEELRSLIAALRRGEIPEVVPPTHLTYK